MNPKTFEIAFLKAMNAARKGDKAEAHRILFALDRAAPGNPRVAKAMAELRGGQAVAESTVQVARIPVAKLRQPPAEEIQKLIELSGTDRFAEAAALGEAMLERYPTSPMIRGLLGPTYSSLGRHENAERVLRDAIKVVPNVAELYSSLGDASKALGRLDQAAAAYAKAVELKPGYAKAHHNLGNVFKAQGRFEEATASIARAIELDPGVALAHYGLGDAWELQGQLDKALECYVRAVEIDPQLHSARGAAINKRMYMCDWSEFDRFAEFAPTMGIGEGVPVAPLGMMAMEDEPARHRARAQLLVRADFPKVERQVFAAPGARPGRLRIGYFSSDLRDSHPVMSLVSGLFRSHDRSRFEITCYASHEDSRGELRAALEKQVDRMVDIRAMGDPEAVALARSHGLDIAVDLNGHTLHSRSRLFAYGIAPVQVGYLGFPGTMAAPFMDYLVADPVVIPEAERAHYAESLLVLPHSYMPADNRRPLAAPPHPRAHYGLPDEGLVFCCFNNNVKMTPREFDVWMRLLKAVPGSVAWLLGANPWARANLLREAEARGVDPARLVFTERVDKGEHLARQQHAVLFLDTFAYNAHTTACEALWAGLPVVTMQGRSFAARVASSLLTAVGLPELITRSVEDYEALALALATDPARLADLRARLGAQRPAAPLFDTEGHTRSLEALYDAAYARFLEGQPPADIRL